MEDSSRFAERSVTVWTRIGGVLIDGMQIIGYVSGDLTLEGLLELFRRADWAGETAFRGAVPTNASLSHPLGVSLVGTVGSFLLIGIACGPEVSLDQGADAKIYILAECEDRCSKYAECAPLVTVAVEECSVSRCVESFSEDLGDPCFAEEDEFFRCRVERLSCEEYFTSDIDSLPGSTCYDFLVVLGECREGNPRS